MSISPTTNPAATTPVASTAATSGSTSTGSNAALSFTQNFNTFLTLLTTQLQNQDPLSPMDSNTFTQQLVEFSQVEQQINTNNNLQSLIQLQSAGETISSIPLVGDQIEYNSATAPLQNGQATFNYTLPTAATTNELIVTDANGNVLYNAAGNTTAGTSNFVWNGETNSGQQMPNGGNYTLQVVATDANNNPITATIQSTGTVNSVAVSNGQPTFNINGLSVPMTELVTVNPASASSN